MHVTEKIDEVADRFEAAWKSGSAPQIEAYLKECPPAARLALLAELIRIDMAVRSRRGSVPQLSEYLAQFPELGPDSDAFRELSDYWNRLATVDGIPGSTDAAQPVSHAGPQETLPDQPKIGRFILQAQLGSGSFGTVWRAYDDRLDRHVAVKILRGAAFAGSVERSRFLREARSVAQLRHESIVAIHEAGEHDGISYLVSELVRGQTLQERVAERRFSSREAAELVAVVARALDYAHRQGVIHRDVKPSNILLDEHGRPFLTDFGLAKWTNADGILTADGQVIGAPAYMSPEQAAGRIDQHDGRSDVYSLGVVLYELLTGKRPFRGALQMLLRQIQEDEPPPPRRTDDRIPRDLETICLKAMSKEPSRRYQTASGFADDLTRFLNGEPIQARPVSWTERVVRWCRRNPYLAGAAALGLFATVVISLAFAVQTAAANREIAEFAQQVTDGNAQLRREQEQTLAALRKIRQLSAHLAFDRGLMHSENGEFEHCLLWLVRALNEAPEDDKSLQRLLRNNVAAWQRELSPLQSSIPIETRKVSGVSSDGRLAAVTGPLNTVRVWDLESEKPVGPLLEHPLPVWDSVFSPQAKMLATRSGNGQYAYVWDLQSGNLLATLEDENLSTLRILSWMGEKYLLLGGPKGTRTIRCFDLSQNRFRDDEWIVDDSVAGVVVGPQVGTFHVVSDAGMLRTFKLESDHPLREPVSVGMKVDEIVGSSDGTLAILVGGRPGTVFLLWDLDRQMPLGKPIESSSWLVPPVFNSDGSRFLFFKLDYYGLSSTVEVWNTSTQARELDFDVDKRLKSVHFQADGLQIVTAALGGLIEKWDHEGVRDGQNRFTPLRSSDNEFVEIMRLTADGAFAITAGTLEGPSPTGFVRIWDSATGNTLGDRIEFHKPVRAGEFCRDDRAFAVAYEVDEDVVLEAWSVSGRKLLQRAHLAGKSVRMITTRSATDDIIILAEDDKSLTVHQWDWRSKEGPAELHAWDHLPHRVLAVHADSSLLVGIPTNKSISTGWFQQLSDGEMLASPLRHLSAVSNAAFADNGALVATGSEDGSVRLWTSPEGRVRVAPLAHPSPITSLGFAERDRTLWVGTFDGRLYQWDVQTGRPLSPFFVLRDRNARDRADGYPAVRTAPPDPLRRTGIRHQFFCLSRLAPDRSARSAPANSGV